jgi:hypothetical protein
MDEMERGQQEQHDDEPMELNTGEGFVHDENGDESIHSEEGGDEDGESEEESDDAPTPTLNSIQMNFGWDFLTMEMTMKKFTNSKMYLPT